MPKQIYKGDKMDNKIYDVIIIGGGPAGMTAAIYAKRAMLSTLLIDRGFIGGGQILNTYEVDNYPGLAGISGYDLGEKMSEHADKFGVEKVCTTVLSADLKSETKKITTDDGEFLAKTVILASGNSPSKLNVKGEEDFTGLGVSYCATCDGAFFKGKVTAVVGGGDVAIEDAIFLSRGCEKVYLIHRRNELRAAKILQDNLFKTPNIEVIYDSVVTEINGDDLVNSINVKNVKTNDTMTLSVSGIFLAVGNTPNSDFIDGPSTDSKGYIIADESCETDLPGVFVAGDLRTKALRQVVTAVADGANAITSVQNYLLSQQ